MKYLLQLKKSTIITVSGKKENVIMSENNNCEHKWIHLETIDQMRVYRRDYDRTEFVKTDRFFCEKCCEIKEFSKKIDYNYYEYPDWFNPKNSESIRLI